MRRAPIASSPLLLLATLALSCGPAQPDPASPGLPSSGPEARPAGDGPAAPSETRPAEPSAADTHVVLDNETLRLEATPQIPDAMRRRLERYLDVRRAALTDLSDDGKRVLVLTRFGQTDQIHLVERPGGMRTQLTFGSEPSRGGAFVPGDENAILYTADIGGNEQHQIYRFDRTSGEATRLTDAGARNGEALWSRDGKWLAFSSNTRNKRDFDVWISNGKDRESAVRIVDAKGWWYPVDWSWDGTKLLVGEYISANESHLYWVDVNDKKVTRLSPPAKATYETARFGKNGTTVYLTSDREGQFAELYETDLSGSSWRSLTRSIPWNIDGLAMAPDGRTLAFTANEGGYSVLYLLDTRSRKIKPVKNLPRGLIGGLQFARKAKDVLGFTFLSSTRPGDVYTYDVRKNKLTRFTESEMAGLRAENLIEPELITYSTFDGIEIPAFYYRPRGAGPFPVIIDIHGGPEGQSRPSFSSFTQYAVAAGFAVLEPNVRGSEGYGKDYLALDNGELRENSVKDIGGLLDWIGTRPELAAKRVGVLGGSYGGYMVLASLVHFPDRIAAGVDVVGISNFVTFLENTADYRRDLRRVEYGDERDPKMRAFLQTISPTTNVGKIASPLFVAQGANDPRVPAGESRQIVDAVRGGGHDVWYMLAKNEGHGFRKKENRDAFVLLTMMFFEKHLGQ